MSDGADGPALPRGGVVRRLALGFGLQWLNFAALLAAQFLAVPLCLAAWGAEVYADWLLLSATAGLLSLADLGFQGHLTNSLRLAWARGDWAGGQRVLQTGLCAYLGLTAVAATAVAVLVQWGDVPAWLGVSRLDAPIPTLALLGAATIVLLPRGLVVSIHTAKGRFDRELAGFLLLQIAQQGSLIVGTAADASPLHVAAGYLAATVLFGWGALVWGLRRHHPEVSLRPLCPRPDEIRRLARQAPFHAVQQGTGVALLQAPVIALGYLAAPAAVIAFTTMRTFTGLVRHVGVQFATATGLEMARLHARGDHPAAARLYAATTPMSGAMMGLIAGLALGIGEPFFAVWTHGAVDFDPVLAAAFLATALLMAPGYGATGLLRLADRARVVANGHLAQIGAAVALGLLAIPPMGALGAAVALGAAELLTSGAYLVGVAGGLLQAPMPGLVARTYATAALALGFGAAIAHGARGLVPGGGAPSLAAVVMLWSVAAAVPAVFLVLDAGQRAWLRARWREWSGDGR